MNKPRFTPDDFENTSFAAIKTKDGRYSHFLKTDVNDLWLLGSGGRVSLDYLIDRGAFPVFADPYSPEALRFAWEHASGPTQEEIDRAGGEIRGVSMFVDNGSNIKINADANYSHFRPDDRFLWWAPANTKAQEIQELLADEIGDFDREDIKRVSEAIAELGTDIIDILDK